MFKECFWDRTGFPGWALVRAEIRGENKMIAFKKE